MVNKIKILIIEFEDSFSKSIVNALKESAYQPEITYCANLQCAKENFTGTTFDLVILDLDLPSDENEPITNIFIDYPTLPIIILVEDVNAPIAQRSLKLGASDFIQKNKDSIASIRQTLEHTYLRLTTKAELLNLEGKFRAVFENIEVGIALVDLNGYPIEINSFLESYLGYPLDELSKMSFPEFTYPDDIEKDVDLFKKLLNKEIKNYEIDKRYIRKNGDIVWASLNVSLLRDYKDEAIYLISIVRDITTEMETRRKLNEETMLMDALMEQIPDAIYFKDRESRFIRINKSLLDKHGFKDLSDVIGKSDFDLFDTEHAEKAYSDEKEIILSRKPKEGIIEKEVFNDGSVEWAHTTKCPLIDKEGNVLGTFGISRNITHRINTEEALKENEARFRSLYQNLTIGIYRANIDGKIIFANPAVVTMLGYNKIDEFLDLDINKHGYVDKSFRQQFINKIIEDKEIVGFENQWQKPNGELIYLRESARLSTDETGNPLYYEGTVEDITEKKKAEEQIKKYNEELKSLNASKDKFFSIIAHDLRSPFTALLGYSDIIKNDFDEMNSDEIKEYSGYIYNEAKNVYSLLDNLLTWSRIQTGRLEYNPEKIDIGKMIRRVIELYSESMKTKNISLSSEISENIFVYVDENMIYTTIRNLLSNALKFTNEGGKIKIIGAALEGVFVIGVKDNGVGMNEESINKLFRVDVHHTTMGTGKEKGTGLGLLLCKDLVEKNGGKIWVDSELGVGTTFWFSSPINEEN